MRLLAFLALPLVSSALLPRQDPRVNYPDLPACFGYCFQSIRNPCSQTDIACFCGNEALIGNLSKCLQSECKDGFEIEKAVTFGTRFCQAGGVAITPSLDSMIPTSTVPAGEGMSTVAASLLSVIAEVTSNVVPAESTPATPTSTSSPPPATSSSVSASSVKSSVSSVPGSASSAAATTAPSNAAGGLIAPTTGLLAVVLAVVLTM